MTSITNEGREIRLAVVSDIHLGCKRNKADFIIANLNKYLSNDTFLASIDLLVLAGDVYDELLNASSDEVALIDLWIGRLLRKCQRYNVTIRVLAGTPSHDRGQSRRFETINELNERSGKKAAKLRYVDNLEIEYLTEFGLQVLYVPDEWSTSAQDTLDQVRTLLKQHQLATVDLAFMHGNFPHQLPAGIGHIPMHDDVAYSEIVSRLIFIGHIHVASVYGKIYAQGSFDRLSHNEEAPKGFLRAVLTQDSYVVSFIENKSAAVYATLACDADSVTDNLMNIGERVKAIAPGANLRIEAHFTNPIHANMGVVKERWPQFKWSSVVRGKDKKTAAPLIDHRAVYVPVALNRQNLQSVMLSRLAEKGYGETIMANCSELLRPFTGG